MSTKPSLALIPSAYKASKVYSVLPNDGTGDFDFSRPTEATRINKDGLIETVGSNVPRLNYPMIDGVVSGCPSLLLEPARTNLVTYSEDFSQGYWTKTGSSITSGFISPDGNTNAFKLVEDSATSAHELEVTGIAVVADKYTMSLFAKAGERSKVRVQLRNYFAGDPSVIFDLENGTFEQNSQAIGSMTLLSNGFYKCTFTTILNAIAGGNAILNVNLVDEANQISYTGDGTSGLYIFGAMLEQGSYPTSYIPTNGSSVTRDAETCSQTTPSGIIGQTEMTLFFDIKPSATLPSYTQRIVTLYQDSSNLISFQLGSVNDLTFVSVKSGEDPVVISKGAPALNLDSFNKVSVSIKSNRFVFYVNGVKVGQDLTSGKSMPLVSNIIFANYNLAEPFLGNIKQLQYFDSALNDTDLEYMTSWRSFNEMARELLYTIE